MLDTEPCSRPLAEGEEATLRVAVVVASKGRPEELGELLRALDKQSHAPEVVVLSVTAPSDVPSGPLTDFVSVITGEPGVCAQRNRALDRIVQGSDIIAFFDDDYVPSRDALERISLFFADHPDVVGANGILLADGIGSGGICAEAAAKLVEEYDHRPLRPAKILRDLSGLYGCNMVFRASAIGKIRFDEALPLYGWQEDIDFSNSLIGQGRLVKTDAFVGVHRGVKGGRISGVRFGYSQIANPYYLARKGTMRRRYALQLALRNALANHIRALRPEPWVDRWGRVRGNWLAVLDLLRGSSDPGRILQFD